MHNERKRSNGHKLKVEITPWHREYFLFCRMSNDGSSSEILWSFHLEDMQNSAGHCPECPKVGWPWQVILWLPVLSNLKQVFPGLRIHLLNLASMIFLLHVQKKIRLWWFIRFFFHRYIFWNQWWLNTSTSHPTIILDNFTFAFSILNLCGVLEGRCQSLTIFSPTLFQYYFQHIQDHHISSS